MHTLRLCFLAFVFVFLTPLALHAAWWLSHDNAVAWSRADWSSARLLPPASAKPEALVHVYAARTGRWKGIFAHHSWIVIKPRGAAAYTRYDKVAWGRPVKVDGWAPDARWYGHQPQLVGSVEGPAAEALIEKSKVAPALLLTDYVMPGMNGHELATRMRARFPGIKVLIMSAHIDEPGVQEGVLEESFRAGALFLQKPFEPEALLRRVRSLLIAQQ